MEAIWPTPTDVALTCLRWLIGIAAGTMLGVGVAVAEGAVATRRRRGWRLLAICIRSALDFLRSIPILAIVPMVIMLGVKERWKIGLIGWAVSFPIWISIRHARTLEMIDAELALAASGLSRTGVFRTYTFPKLLIGLLHGIETAIGIAWISVVAAESFGTFTKGFWAGGLGHKAIQAYEANNWSGLLLCLVLFGTLGLGSALLWRRLLELRSRSRTGFNPMAGYGR